MKPSDIERHRKGGRDKLKAGKGLHDLTDDEFLVLLADAGDETGNRSIRRMPRTLRHLSARLLRDSPQGG